MACCTSLDPWLLQWIASPSTPVSKGTSSISTKLENWRLIDMAAGIREDTRLVKWAMGSPEYWAQPSRGSCSALSRTDTSRLRGLHAPMAAEVSVTLKCRPNWGGHQCRRYFMLLCDTIVNDTISTFLYLPTLRDPFFHKLNQPHHFTVSSLHRLISTLTIIQLSSPTAATLTHFIPSSYLHRHPPP